MEISKLIVFAALVFSLASCKSDKAELEYASSGYPPDVAKIIVNKCATAGCHNEASRDASAGLSLETWDKLFEGSRSGAVVIPYRPDFSTLFFYTNTYADYGQSLLPRMPVGKPALSRDEMTVLKNWITNGAPNNKGLVKFSDNPLRKKAYVINKGCDVVTVLDAATGLAMRYIDVGTSAQSEGPTMIKVSPDNQFWYVVLYTGTVLQKFRVSDDSYVGQIAIGNGFWSSFTISADSKKAFVVNSQFNGALVYVDLEKMQVASNYSIPLSNPFNCVVNKAFTKLYVTAQDGNYIYKIDISDPLNPTSTEVSMETGQPVMYSGGLSPYDIVFSPDESTYFVTCVKTTELRIMQTANDSLLAAIPLNVNPAQIDVAQSMPYLFVTCMGSVNGAKKSAVFVIDYKAYSVVTSLYVGFESRGVAIDELHKKVFVSNRNESGGGGPAAHHKSACGGKNGYITCINLNTLLLDPDYKTEVSVDPYQVAMTH